jgi:hypothetical protein
MSFGLLSLLLPLVIVIGIIIVIVGAVRRGAQRSGDTGEGADLVAYLVMAIAVGGGSFALAELFATAFPGDQLVFDPTSNLATSLSALLVSTPFAIYFWRRQASRRASYPRSVGWTLYLTLIELVFGVAVMVTGVLVLTGLFTDSSAASWTRLVVYLAVLIVHELAARNSPPQSDGAELPTVVGSGIGLVTLSIGLAGLLGDGVLSWAFEALGGATDPGYSPWAAMSVLGGLYWGYRWWTPWHTESGLPRRIYVVLTTSFALLTAFTGMAAILALSITYVLGDTSPAGEHFRSVPVWLGSAIVGLFVWLIHRKDLDTRDDTLRAYEYFVASIASFSTVGWAVALIVLALQERQIVGGDADDVLTAAAVLVISASVWLWFATRHNLGDPDEERAAWPRRVHLLGMGVILGLVGAGSLITTLFILISRLLGERGSTDLVTPIALTVVAGTAAWYMLSNYLKERASMASPEVISPFEVTIVSSHPGGISAKFPKQATVRVLHRGDGAGVITDDLADQIVAAVGHQSSFVWVDDDGFRIAPAQS